DREPGVVTQVGAHLRAILPVLARAGGPFTGHVTRGAGRRRPAAPAALGECRRSSHRDRRKKHQTAGKLRSIGVAHLKTLLRPAENRPDYAARSRFLSKR